MATDEPAHQDDVDAVMEAVNAPRRSKSWEDMDFDEDDTWFTKHRDTLVSQALKDKLNPTNGWNVVFNEFLGMGWEEVPSESVQNLKTW